MIIVRIYPRLSCQLKLGRAFAVGAAGEYGAVALACLGPRQPGYDELEALDVTKVNFCLLYTYL